MKKIDNDKELAKRINNLTKKFLDNCPSAYQIRQYDAVSEISIELKELKRYLYKIQKNRNLKKLSISSKPIPLRVIRKLAKLSQLEEIELCNYSNEILLQKTLILLNKFKNLQKLTIHNSNIKYIPKEIGELQTLTELRVYFTNIKSLPLEIGSLTELQILDISNDQVDSLPHSVCNLKMLKEITVFTYLTNDINILKKNLPNLSAIYIMNNNFENLLENTF